MLFGLPISHLLVLIVQLVGIVLPFFLITHAQHARIQIVVILGLTLIGFVLFLLFGHASGRSDLVLLRSYSCSSALSSLVDELHSMREGKKMRLIVLVPFAMIFMLALVCLIGGINGSF